MMIHVDEQYPTIEAFFNELFEQGIVAVTEASKIYFPHSRRPNPFRELRFSARNDIELKDYV